MNVREAIERMRAEVRGEIYGPETLYGMVTLFERYERALKLAEHNRSGRNPSNPRDCLGYGEKLQVEADWLAHCFPSFPAALERRNREQVAGLRRHNMLRLAEEH